MINDRQLGQVVADWQPPPAPNNLSFRGKHVFMQPLRADKHAVPLFAANKQDRENRIWDYMPYGPFDVLEDYLAWLRSIENCPDPYFLTIAKRSNNTSSGESNNRFAGNQAGDYKDDAGTSLEICGLASYLRVHPESGSIEVGHINFAPPLQNTIAATEVMYLMMKWAFSNGYRRYEWKCNALNRRSRRAAQRLGLSYEGVFRQATIQKGRNRDSAWFAAIDKEWPALQNCFETYLNEKNFDAAGQQIISLSSLTKKLLAKTDPLFAG